MGVSYQQHKARWGGCRDCELFRTRKTVVLARGTVPANVLFVGEAPGASEDVLGRPFEGPAGKLLDKIIWNAIWNEKPHIPDHPYRFAFTNVICCLPIGEGDKLAEPPKWAVEACAPRLREFIDLADPKLVVCVGKHATRWVPHDPGRKYLDMVHPAAILRFDDGPKRMAIARCVVTLREAMEEL